MALNTRGGRRRAKRRAKRRAARTAQPQYLGGSKASERALLDTAEQETAEARQAREEATGKLYDVGERASELERKADTDYRGRRDDATRAREEQRASIGGLGTASSSAQQLRNEALLRNDANAAAAHGIQENEAVAAQRLGLQQNMLARRARGLAGSMGEGGALAMQSAIQGANAGGADLAAQNAVTQAEQAAAMRQRAAEQRIANAMAVADANAGLTYQTGQDVVSAQQAARGLDLQAQGAATERQLNLLGQRGAAVGAGAGTATSAAGQEIGSQTALVGGQLSAAQANEEARLKSAEANSLAGRFARVRTATSGGLLS